jgi:hypothetical protein
MLPNRYRVTFEGRAKGAIGIFYPITLHISAESEEAARLKVYDTHDPYFTPKVQLLMKGDE